MAQGPHPREDSCVPAFAFLETRLHTTGDCSQWRLPMLSTSRSANVTGNTNRVEATSEPLRAAKQRLTELGLGPATRQAPATVVMRAAVIGTVLALHALPAAAQSARDVKGPTPLVAIQNEAPAKLIVDP